MRDKIGSFSDHFHELKVRLAIIIMFFLCSLALSYYYSDSIYQFLLEPLEIYFRKHNLQREIIYTGLSEAFFTYLKLSCYVAIILTFPIFIFQIYRFISPGLKKNEKSFIKPILIFAPILFVSGILLVYYYVLPSVFDFFLSFEEVRTKGNMPIILEARVSEYLSLCLSIMLAFGIAFQLPILLVILTKIKLLRSQSLVKFRRFAIVIIFTIAAIITPPDIISQVILAVIMIILYELSIFICKLIERKN